MSLTVHFPAESSCQLLKHLPFSEYVSCDLHCNQLNKTENNIIQETIRELKCYIGNSKHGGHSDWGTTHDIQTMNSKMADINPTLSVGVCGLITWVKSQRLVSGF